MTSGSLITRPACVAGSGGTVQPSTGSALVPSSAGIGIRTA